jgi:hypothetical protein
MRKSSGNSDANFPEYGVRREIICGYFHPPMPRSTFHDLVNQGKITPFKYRRGFYKLNDSLRRLGLKEVAELPKETPTRSTEGLIRFAFSVIDPEVFPDPSWLLDVEVIDERDADHAIHIIEKHRVDVEQIADFQLKHAYFKGVLDAAYMQNQDLQGELD